MTAALLLALAASAAWAPAPGLPPGTELSVLAGDMKAQGLFTARLRLAKGFRLEPHRHPVDEHLTVLSGEYCVGEGTSFDEKKLRRLGPGDFSLMPAGRAHFTRGEAGTVLQISAQGPWRVEPVAGAR